MRRTPATRICIIEDHRLFAEALDGALTQEGHDVHQVDPSAGSVQSGRLVTETLRLHPQTVILDLNLGSAGDGARLVRPLTQAGIAVLVVTASVEPARWGECLRDGAWTVIAKSSPLNAILAAIRGVAAGRSTLTHEERERLVEDFHQERRALQGLRERLRRLTPREQQVLVDLREGRTVSEIAEDFVVSEATVRTQVRSILAKLAVKSQLAAVSATYRAHWRPVYVPTHHPVPGNTASGGCVTGPRHGRVRSSAARTGRFIEQVDPGA